MTPTFIQFRGGIALSSFKKAQILDRLKAIEPSISDLNAHYVHWVSSEEELGDRERSRIESLLQPAGSHDSFNPGLGKHGKPID